MKRFLTTVARATVFVCFIIKSIGVSKQKKCGHPKLNCGQMIFSSFYLNRAHNASRTRTSLQVENNAPCDVSNGRHAAVIVLMREVALYSHSLRSLLRESLAKSRNSTAESAQNASRFTTKVRETNGTLR